MRNLIFHLDWPNFKGNKSGTTYLFQSAFPSDKHIHFKPSTSLFIKSLHLLRALTLIVRYNKMNLVLTEVGNLRYGVFDIVSVILDWSGKEYVAMVHMTSEKLSKWYYKPHFVRFKRGRLITYNECVVALLKEAYSVTVIPHYASESYLPLVKENVVIINGKQQRNVAQIDDFISDNKGMQFWAVNVDVAPADNVVYFPRLDERTLAYLYAKAKYSLCLYKDLNGSNVLSNSIQSGCIPIIDRKGFYDYYKRFMTTYVFHDDVERLNEGGGQTNKLKLNYSIDAIREVVGSSSLL